MLLDASPPLNAADEITDYQKRLFRPGAKGQSLPFAPPRTCETGFISLSSRVDYQVGLMLDGDYAEHAMRELQRRADANPDDVSSSEGPLDSDDDAATVETASAETASGNAHSWCVIS